MIPKVGDHIIAVAPVFLDAYPRLQKDLRAHEAFAVLARIRADFFEHLAILADDNALVAGLFTVDRCVEVDNAVVAFREFCDLDRRTMRNFLFQIPAAFRG